MKKGFTLIELLVVIAIIGLLSIVIVGAIKDSTMSPSDKTAHQKKRCAEKVDAGYALKDLPAYCVIQQAN